MKTLLGKLAEVIKTSIEGTVPKLECSDYTTKITPTIRKLQINKSKIVTIIKYLKYSFKIFHDSYITSHAEN